MNVCHISAYINLYINWLTSLIIELRIMISKAMGEALIDVTQPDKLLSCVINKELLIFLYPIYVISFFSLKDEMLQPF